VPVVVLLAFTPSPWSFLTGLPHRFWSVALHSSWPPRRSCSSIWRPPKRRCAMWGNSSSPRLSSSEPQPNLLYQRPVHFVRQCLCQHVSQLLLGRNLFERATAPLDQLLVERPNRTSLVANYVSHTPAISFTDISHGPRVVLVQHACRGPAQEHLHERHYRKA